MEEAQIITLMYLLGLLFTAFLLLVSTEFVVVMQTRKRILGVPHFAEVIRKLPRPRVNWQTLQIGRAKKRFAVPYSYNLCEAKFKPTTSRISYTI